VARIIEVVAPTEQRDVRLWFGTVVEAHRILTLYDGARTKRRKEDIHEPVDLAGVPRTDRRLRQDLAVEQLHAFLGREDAGVSHRVVLVDREEAWMKSDCHSTDPHRTRAICSAFCRFMRSFSEPT
jgi:hypothetical protein